MTVRLGVSVALAQLVYEALIVTDCPASIVDELAVMLHPAAHVTTTPEPLPVQSFLQCPGVPLRAQSSHASFGVTVLLAFRGMNHSVAVWIPQLPSVVPVALSTIPSQQRAT